MKTALIINDVQAPFHDPVVWKALLQFAGDFHPSRVVVNGDFFDCYEVSDFDKDPKRITNFQKEIDVGRKMLVDLINAAQPDDVDFNGGNHEDRLRRTLWRQPSLASLDGLGEAQVFGLDSLGIEYRPYGEGFWLNKELFITHGDMVRRHSSYTAKAMQERYGCSRLSGPTHRLGVYYNVAQTQKGPKVYGWWENGCLCALTPEYVDHPQWQQGFCIVYYDDTGRFQVVQVPVLDGKFIVNGEAYGKR